MVAPEVAFSRVMSWERPIAPAPGLAVGVSTLARVYGTVSTALSVMPDFTAIALTVAGRLESVKGPVYTVPVLAVGLDPLVVYRMVAPEVLLSSFMGWVRPIAPAPGVANGVATVPSAATVTVHVAGLLPSVVRTVIVAFPGALAVTTPSATVATVLLSVDQVTVWLVAFEGATVAVTVSVPSTVRLTVVLLSVTPVTEITGLSGLSVDGGSENSVGSEQVEKASVAMAINTNRYLLFILTSLSILSAIIYHTIKNFVRMR
jgi:hypothetical protein